MKPINKKALKDFLESFLFLFVVSLFGISLAVTLVEKSLLGFLLLLLLTAIFMYLTKKSDFLMSNLR